MKVNIPYMEHVGIDIPNWQPAGPVLHNTQMAGQRDGLWLGAAYVGYLPYSHPYIYIHIYIYIHS